MGRCRTAADQAQTGNYPAAIELINQAIQQDRLRENFYCLAMAYYAAVDDRSGLIRCYQRLAQELMEAFQLPPSPHTQQQYQQLLAYV